MAEECESEIERLTSAFAAEKEAMRKDAELNCYRGIGEERRKGEAREMRLIEQLEAVKLELFNLKKDVLLGLRNSSQKN